jgi:CHAD domain-containing protein
MARELPTDLARHLSRMLKRTRRRYRRRLADCQAHFSEPAVHDLRVETRRALTLLELISALRLAAVSGKARRLFKQRLDAYDDLRDTHVALGLVEPRLKRFPEAAPLMAWLRRREKLLTAILQRELRSLKSREVERLLKALGWDLKESAAKAAPAGARLLTVARRSFARVQSRRRQLRAGNTPAIHRLRVAFKHYRYLCDFLHSWLPGMTRRKLRRMRQWQTRLGDIQDLAVLLRRIEREVRHEEIPLATVKELHAALARRLAVLVNRCLSRANELAQFAPVPAKTRKRKLP